jgi:integrase
MYPDTKERINDLITEFRDFELVDLRRGKKTICDHVYYVRKFLEQLQKPVKMVFVEDVRAYFKSLNGASCPTYKNTLSALKVFFRDFLSKPQLVESFKFPRQQFKPKRIVTKEQLRWFFEYLETPKERTLFLLYASSGLRRNELINLEPANVDLNNRMITPCGHKGETKKPWVSFFNSEAEKALNEYLTSKKPSTSPRIFPMPRSEERGLWKIAKEQTRINVTPQRLREWFCCEMALLGVNDRYIDAFCGRTPKSILARNYTDYAPEKLEQIYEKANLKVLT